MPSTAVANSTLIILFFMFMLLSKLFFFIFVLPPLSFQPQGAVLKLE